MPWRDGRSNFWQDKRVGRMKIQDGAGMSRKLEVSSAREQPAGRGGDLMRLPQLSIVAVESPAG
jgi:hypothetical protein